MESKHNNPAGRNCGKGVSHRLQEIDDKFKKSGGIFKEYKIGELFEASNGNTDIQAKHINGKGYYVVSSGLLNCGIIGKSDIEANIFDENTITIDMFGNVFVRDFKYKLVTHARVFSLKLQQEPPKNIYIKILLYIATQLSFLNKIFSYNNMCSYNKIANFKIFLPTLNNKLAFEYMEERIRELESERIRELDAYLQATGLNNYILDENDRGGVNRLIENKIELKEYKAGELFTVKSSKKKFNANNLNITNDYNLYPYVARGSSNNGIKGYISEDTEFLNNENTIAFGQDTATCFYQDKPYFTGDKIKILSPINFQLNNHIGLYIISSMKKTLKHLSWGQNSFNEDFIKNIKIKLPIKNNNIDFNYMEQLIKTLEKIIIKDVIDFKDKIIKTHKEICRI